MFHSAVSVLALAIFAVLPPYVSGQDRNVDFRWAPEQHFTVIGLPDDWQKTMTTETGALAYDFGPGPYARNLTSVQFGVKGTNLTVKDMRLPNGKTPIVTTLFTADKGDLQTTTFAIVPEWYVSPKPKNQLTEKVSRFTGINGARGWVVSPDSLDPAFANVAWGTNRAIRYTVDVERGQSYKVATGFLEGWKSTAGARPLEIHVEGSQIITIDPLADGIRGKAYVHILAGRDTNLDGKLNIEIHPSATGPDPNTILNVFWVFPDALQVTADAVARGEHNDDAIVYFDCGLDAELAAKAVRYDAMRARSTIAGAPITLQITTNRSLSWTPGSTMIYSQYRPFVHLGTAPISVERDGRNWVFTFPETHQEVYAVVLSGADTTLNSPDHFDIDLELRRAANFWESNNIIPKNAIQVPDESIQFLADASLRNMYQVREFVDGRMQFQPGPSVYRGLWIGDFNSGAALATGDTASVREYAETIIGIQNAEGHYRTMVPNLSYYENPVFLTAAFQYALATQNLDWLNQHWTSFSQGVEWMKRQRSATLTNSDAPNYGLLPAGFVDGGISELNADYGSVFWTLTALEYGIQAANLAGHDDQAEDWLQAFTDMRESLERSISRDLQQDANGVSFLPTLVGIQNPQVPQLGSYGYIWPAKFSHFMLDKDTLFDTVMEANLTFYDTRLSQGLLESAGWLAGGLWHWLSAMHGSIQLEHGWREEGIKTLYALSNHAAPTGTWVEEQLPAQLGNRTTGDVSNSQSSAAYYMLVRDLIAIETREGITLLRGIPIHWLEPGKTVSLSNSYTNFGPLNLQLTTSEDGSSLTLTFDTLERDGFITIDPTIIEEAGFDTAEKTMRHKMGTKIEIKFTKR